MKEINPTAAKIADIAEKYIQCRGFNGFSFRDIQDELGIKTASIHYHYKTKQDLAIVVFERYLERYKTALITIEQQQLTAVDKLKALADIFITVRNEGKLCLCGMYASDFYSLTDSLETQLNRFVTFNEQWITQVITDGITKGEFPPQLVASEAARLYFVSLEGCMLISQFKDTNYIQTVVNNYFNVVLNTPF
ncbi:TetR/AcrR family transcriptional regulator [Photobacterium kishitanii]|uniref:TetR/AcrR family transcriptional regulator n=1 Tax=Photobacterium kishitanii TaxID=318456 RepID=A0A2T3R1B1_9GAMM|nr:TetR/AcrR family transcriptional regulator [Photobacterium kishitanii]KJG11636.1 TetR family transcriptional regulator [Photobacterium kishitanii]KJG59054.1 TetR family transcriptional regulator [Photobacterium kishitanii]KJG62021.1 TetR family transcriptional regulator [Photobacterium kishitanii]KJG67244.1 TetR family transcriptional regulator [Photobacterium kishitanii]KJG70509.1 TetR family transcriptional regulator [Photobacterium kishitanii]